MGWKVWAEVWKTGELSNANKFQSIKFNKNLILRALRTWIVVYNDPIFTNLNAKIYSNEIINTMNAPKKLLYTSSKSLSKSQIITLENGIKEIYFEFNYVPINGDDTYNIVINGTDYVYGLGSHLGWVKAWPDPIYREGYTPTYENLLVAPYQVYAIGGEF